MSVRPTTAAPLMRTVPSRPAILPPSAFRTPVVAALSALSFSTLPLSVSGMVNSSAIATTTSSPSP